MRRATVRTVGVAVIALLLVGVDVGVGSSAPTAAAGYRVTASTTPCTSMSYSLAVSSPALSISVSGQVDFTSDAATANITLPSSFPIASLAGTTLQAEFVGATAYLAVPAALSSFVGGAPWVSVTLPSGVGPAVSALFAQVAAWCADAPSVIAAFGSHRGARTSLGSLSIQNVPATGTQVVPGGRRVSALLKLPPAITKKAKGLFGRGKIPVDVWANAQNQLVQLSIGGSGASVTLSLSNIDQPVSITAPTGAVPLPPSVLKLLGSL